MFSRCLVQNSAYIHHRHRIVPLRFSFAKSVAGIGGHFCRRSREFTTAISPASPNSITRPFSKTKKRRAHPSRSTVVAARKGRARCAQRQPRPSPIRRARGAQGQAEAAAPGSPTKAATLRSPDEAVSLPLANGDRDLQDMSKRNNGGGDRMRTDSSPRVFLTSLTS
jgi:hypothetical protein